MPGTKFGSAQEYSATGGLLPITNPNNPLFLFFGVVHMEKDGPAGQCVCGFNTFSLAAQNEQHAYAQIFEHPYYREDLARGWKKPDIYLYRPSHSALALTVVRNLGGRIEEARKQGYEDGLAMGKVQGYAEGFRDAVKKVGSHRRGITTVEID
jgi:hypothetical protein